MPIQFKIVALCSGPEELQVGFVPDFEVPVLNFLDPVPVDTVLSEAPDQLSPLRHFTWRSFVPLVEEGSVAPTGQRSRHKAQFHKRPYATFEHGVKYHIHIEEAGLLGSRGPNPHLV